MRRAACHATFALDLLAALVACGGGGGGGGGGEAPPVVASLCPASPAVAVDGPAWWGFGRDAQHTGLGDATRPTQSLSCIYWQKAVDLAPQLNANGALSTHYGSPVITGHNTVVMPVKTASDASGTPPFRVDALDGHDGSLKWTLSSSYRLPPHNWIPSFNPVLVPPLVAGGPPRLVMPTSGGRVLVREDPDADTGTTREFAFFDYTAAPAIFDATVFINTPITVDRLGNLFFGFQVTGTNPAGLTSGIARIPASGSGGSWVATTLASGSTAFVKPQTNSAPALSNDEAFVYVVVNSAGARPSGRLLQLSASTLNTQNLRDLIDPATGAPAWVSDDSTASPTIGFDGDVFVGVLESNAPGHHFRGWLLHFNGTLTESRTPGSFGWDDTVSVVPTSMVPQHTTSSTYLLLTKYNNYAGGAGGDGRNRVAILDPSQSQSDPIAGAGVRVMEEVITQLGPTPDPEYPPDGVKEWCINTAAVDVATQSVLINSEDGQLYRWHLPSNTFSESIVLNPGRLQSYTPTAIGPDGRVYAVNNATLHSVGKP